jgi:tetratricopeptide (TPR) repeat protein
MKCFRLAPWLPVLLVLVVRIAPAAEVLTNDTIVTMVKGGLGEELILDKIKLAEGQYDLSVAGLLRLKSEGVGENIIKAMLAAPASPESSSPQPDQAIAPRRAEAQEADRQAAIALYEQGKAAEAAAAFDALIAEKPNDDGLKIWKALAQLGQASAMKQAKSPQFKPLVLGAWAILRTLGRRHDTNPEWNLAVGKALWLNDRLERGKGLIEKAVSLRPDFAEARLLLGDMAYDERLASPAADPTARWRSATTLRKEYEGVLALANVRANQRAEALFKLGVVAADLENKPDTARRYWEQAASADPDSRYGKLAQERLTAAAK